MAGIMRSETFPIPDPRNIHLHTCVTPDEAILTKEMAGKQQAFESVTLGHICSHGCRDPLIYCDAIDCNHRSIMNADDLPDELPIGSLGPRVAHRGAGVRPNWRVMTNKPHVWQLQRSSMSASAGARHRAKCSRTEKCQEPTLSQQSQRDSELIGGVRRHGSLATSAVSRLFRRFLDLNGPDVCTRKMPLIVH
jgi:hypothetical protein